MTHSSLSLNLQIEKTISYPPAEKRNSSAGMVIMIFLTSPTLDQDITTPYRLDLTVSNYYEGLYKTIISQHVNTPHY